MAATSAGERLTAMAREKETDVNRRRLELIDPSVNANKFWEVEGPTRDGSTWVVKKSWGRIGSTPQTKIERHSSKEKAEAAIEKIVAEKEGKGYELRAGKLPKKKGRTSGKKASERKTTGTSCDHCGLPSKSPSECREPWEHSYYKGGCNCAYCKKNFGGLAGYRKDLLKVGVGVVLSAQDCLEIQNGLQRGGYKAKGFIKDHGRETIRRLLTAMRCGRFTDGKRTVVVVPPDLKEALNDAVDMWAVM